MSAEAAWRSAFARIESAGGPNRVREPRSAYTLTGHDGWVEAASAQSEPFADDVVVTGRENVVAAGFMSARPTWRRISIKGDRNVIFFAPKSRTAGLDVQIEANDCLLYFGALTSAGRLNVRMREDGQTILLGDRCMCSHAIYLGQPDPVNVYGKNGRRLVPSGDILIEDHVWIGRNVTVKSGSRIGADTVLGQAATIEGEYPPNVILAGSPARVLKSDITWGRSAEPTLDELEASRVYKGLILRQLEIIQTHITSLETDASAD